jgi:SET family sugar efflux transporter-like MFS transporter
LSARRSKRAGRCARKTTIVDPEDAGPYASKVIAHAGRRLLWTRPFPGLFATTFVLGLTGAFMAPFGSLWATQEVGMSAEQLGAFMTINALSAIVLSTWIARWSDSHVARRSLLLVGACAGALGALGYALVRDFLPLVLIGSTAFALASVNFAQLFAHVREELSRQQAGVAAAVSARAQDVAADASVREPKADVPFALGALRACFALAWVVGPNLGAAIKERFGYQGLFLAASGFFALLFACVAWFVAHRPREASSAVARSSVLAALAQPRVLVHCVAFGLMFAASTLNSLNLPLYMTQRLGGTERSVGLAFAISPLFEMAFMVGFGHLASRGHQRPIMLLGSAAAVGYFVLLRFVATPWQVYPLQVLLAAGVAVTASVAIPFFQDLLPEQPGLVTSLYSNALKVGSLVGFSSFGLLASKVGNDGLFLVCAGLASLTVTIVAVASPRRS